MINDKFEKTLDFIDLDPKFLISILKKYIIHIIAFVSIITLLVLLFTLNQDKKYKVFTNLSLIISYSFYLFCEKFQ